MIAPADLAAQMAEIQQRLEKFHRSPHLFVREGDTFAQDVDFLLDAVSSLLAQLTEAQQEKENRRPVGEPSLVEQIATVIEVEEVDCRRKEHEGASHHARSIWGACAATCGVLAARVRGFQALEDAAEAHVADLARQLEEAQVAIHHVGQQWEEDREDFTAQLAQAKDDHIETAFQRNAAEVTLRRVSEERELLRWAAREYRRFSDDEVRAMVQSWNVGKAALSSPSSGPQEPQ